MWGSGGSGGKVVIITVVKGGGDSGRVREKQKGSMSRDSFRDSSEASIVQTRGSGCTNCFSEFIE